jgi:hypothetical protein
MASTDVIQLYDKRNEKTEGTIQKQTALATRHIASTQKTISTTHKAKKMSNSDPTKKEGC